MRTARATSPLPIQIILRESVMFSPPSRTNTAAARQRLLRGIELRKPIRSLCRSAPTDTEGENRMAGFLFRLETVDGAAADPPTLEAAVPNWKAGDSIYFSHRTLCVVGVRDDDADQPPVLIVEEA
jgi:hypothetical protein